MGVLDFFSSKKSDGEKKSSSLIPSYIYGLYNTYGNDLFASSLYPSMAYKLYHTIGILKTGVTTKTDEIKTLPLVMRDQRDPDKIIYDNEILKLIRNPNDNTTKEEFLSSLARSLELTNEMWVRAIGDINRTPIELHYVEPYNITIFNSLKS